MANSAEYSAIHFYDESITVAFDEPPRYEKSPPCPSSFCWREQDFPIVETLSEWVNFARRGKAARNMRPEHAEVAAGRGSLGVGRFHFRVLVSDGRIFDIYYDRAPQDVDRRKGQWFIYREMQANA